jgi:hypothetical protein
LATIELRTIAEDVLATTGLDGRDDLPRAGALMLELLVALDRAGVFDLALADMPTDPDVDARITGLAVALRSHVDQVRKTTEDAPTSEQLAARQQLATKMRDAATPVINGQPDGLARRTALLLDTLGGHLEHGIAFGGLLPRRFNQVAEALSDYGALPKAFAEGGSLSPGTYRVIKRVEVDDHGARYVDEPGGVPVAGLWAPTLTLIEPLPDGALVELDPADVLGERATVPRRTASEVLEWVGENPGRARAALGVEYSRPDGPREALVAVLTTTIEHAGECVAVWLPAPGRICHAAAGPLMPHRCVAKVEGDQHRRSLVNHECACGTQLTAAEVPGALAQLAGLSETGTNSW